MAQVFGQRRAATIPGYGLGRVWPWAVGGLIMSLLGATPAVAEFPPCPPPAANEYLLLVRSTTEAERTRVQDLLPSNSTVMVCDYLNDTVVRAGGFTNLENANAWAQYMTEVEGLQAFVARPAATTQPTVAPPPGNTPSGNTPSDNTTPPDLGTASPSPTAPASPTAPSLATPPASSATFAPQPLGPGFAVLVDYQYQPEMAASIQQQVGQAVGLAVYRQRSYLLIAQSPDVAGAASTLSVLSSLNIPGFIVDSREVVMLTPAVALTSP
ncbi:MAG: hypothetical protein ACFCVD_08575 [Nodosilinea sp.]